MKAKLRVKCLHLTNVSCSPISSSSKKWSFKQPVFEPVCNKSNCSMYPPFICFCINMNSLIIWPKYHIATHTRHQIANRGQTLPNMWSFTYHLKIRNTCTEYSKPKKWSAHLLLQCEDQKGLLSFSWLHSEQHRV